MIFKTSLSINEDWLVWNSVPRRGISNQISAVPSRLSFKGMQDPKSLAQITAVTCSTLFQLVLLWMIRLPFSHMIFAGVWTMFIHSHEHCKFESPCQKPSTRNRTSRFFYSTSYHVLLRIPHVFKWQDVNVNAWIPHTDNNLLLLWFN